MSTTDNKTVIIKIADRPVAPTTMHGIVAAVFYGVCSVTTAFVNKALMSTLKFDYPVFIMVTQMVFTIVVLETLNLAKVIHLPPYTLSRARNFLWPAIFYGSNAVLALTALSHMNIAMYGVLKRCVPLSIMFLAVLVLKKGLPSRFTLVSVVLLTTGCVIAGYGDMSFHLNGYLCGIFSNFTHAMYLLLVQKYSEKEQSTVETLQLNSFNTLPLLSVACLLNGELGTLHQYDLYHKPTFHVTFFLAVTTGMILNYSLFLCTRLTSALTTSVVGGLKAMVQTMLGLVTFGGVSHNMSTYTGIGMNLVGGIMYIYAKNRESKTKVTDKTTSDEEFKAVCDRTADHRPVSNGYIGYQQYPKSKLSKLENGSQSSS